MKQLDLNLLLVFDAVMTERNFRRAAEKLGRTQPAVSQSVRRLRDVFADPLFLKAPEGATPTPRAEELWRALCEPLAAVRRAAAPDTFEPSTVEGEIALALSDDLELLALPEVAKRLAEAAPRLSLRAIEADHQSAARLLAEGAADLCLTVAEPARGLVREELYRQPFVILHKRGAKAPSTLAAYCALRHVAVAFSGGAPGYTDRRLAELGRTRRLVATSPRFAALPGLVSATDAVATLPAPVARLLARRWSLAVSPVPFDLPAVPVCLLWHERRRRDPRTLWLRDLVRAAALKARSAVEE